MTEWREVTIEELAEKIAMGPFGSDIKVETFKPCGVPIISGKHLHETRMRDKGFNFISEEHADKLSNANVFRGDVIFTHAGNIGQVSFIPENSKYERYVISQRQFYLRCNSNVLDYEFIAYYFKSPYGQYQLLANANQTGVPSLAQPVSYLKSIKVLLPPLTEQKAIAEVLSSLDDKIDLLTRQNKTLEDLAQAYFRKWFIEDASKEWEVVPISEKFDVLLGGTPSRKIESYWTNGTIGWINSGKINEFRIIEASEYITEEALNNSSAKLLPAGTTVLAITGATLGKISMVLRSFAANQSVIGLVPKAELSNNFIFLWLKENINALISMQTGGAQQHINSNDVKSFDVIVPDTVALSLFRRKIDPLMLKISQNCFQINTLNKLRDTLLPKLISGEIRVKM